ncbi:MAG: hypothetical protein IJ501_00715 [Bacilli bacterium]|nr:hypothetical protein [Bacilli bacterium]
MKKKIRNLILSIVITLILLLTITITYAIFTYQETGTNNQQLVLGDIYMHYKESNTIINEGNMMPIDVSGYIVNPIMKEQSETISSTELYKCINYTSSWNWEDGENALDFCKGTGTKYGDTFQAFIDNNGFFEEDLTYFKENNIIISKFESLDLPYFEFTITGKNTYSEKDIYYEIVLNRGNVPEEKVEENRIKDEFLRFTLIEVKDQVETTVISDQNYNNLVNQRIWVNTISKNQTEEIDITYRLYMWIDGNVVIGNVGQDYTTDEWNNLFASIKVNVLGDFTEKSIYPNFVDVVKSKVGTGGLVAINQEGTLYEENSLNQTSNVYQTSVKQMNTSSIREYRYTGRDVNNYVSFNNETWRIVGVFKDTVKDELGNIVLDSEGNPTYEEKIKLIKNERLSSFPTSYLINGITYEPKYWNKSDLGTNTNDWTSSGLMYYLNSEHDENVSNPNQGYLSTFSEKSKNLISLTTYYLGNFKFDTDTPITAYESERDENNIHDNYEATWNGLIGLAYPSDYGYTADSSYWNTLMSESNDRRFATTWFPGIVGYSVKLISPSNTSNTKKVIIYGWMGYGTVGEVEVISDYDYSVPVLYLKSNTKVIDALGTVDEPYIVVE